MSTQTILTFVLVMIVMHQTSAQSDIYQYVQKRPSNTMNKYCGKNLANALHLLCNGVYNSMFKKSGQEMEMNEYPFIYEDAYPFRSRAIANAMMGRFGASRFRRESRGVHDECCAKPCTIEELYSYCAV